MVTNDVIGGDSEIESSYEQDVVDECEFDGPETWVTDMQNYINEELDHFIIEIFNYSTPCYYAEDLLLIKDTYYSLIKEFNEAYEYIN